MHPLLCIHVISCNHIYIIHDCIYTYIYIYIRLATNVIPISVFHSFQ